MLKIHEKDVNKEGFTVITNSADNIEFEMIKSFLDEEGVKVLEKRSGSGAYLNVLGGFNYQGVDVLVHESDYDKAVDVINSFNESEVTYQDENGDISEEVAEDIQEQARKNPTHLLLIPLIPLAVFILVVALLSLLNR